MKSLVDLLATGSHPLRATRVDGVAALRERVAGGYVLVEFTGTQGGTELGFEIAPLDADSRAALERGTGRVAITGDLRLDFEPVRCHAEIDLETLSGSGGLTRRAEPAGERGEVADV
jgi:hypothetical protein